MAFVGEVGDRDDRYGRDNRVLLRIAAPAAAAELADYLVESDDSSNDLRGDFELYSHVLPASQTETRRKKKIVNLDQSAVFLVRRYARRTLRHSMDRGELDSHAKVEVCRAIFGQIAELHARGVCHSGVVASNLVLMAGSTRWGLTDFEPQTVTFAGQQRKVRASREKDIEQALALVHELLSVTKSGHIYRLGHQIRHQFGLADVRRIESLLALGAVHPEYLPNVDDLAKLFERWISVDLHDSWPLLYAPSVSGRADITRPLAEQCSAALRAVEPAPVVAWNSIPSASGAIALLHESSYAEVKVGSADSDDAVSESGIDQAEGHLEREQDLGGAAGMRLTVGAWLQQGPDPVVLAEIDSKAADLAPHLASQSSDGSNAESVLSSYVVEQREHWESLRSTVLGDGFYIFDAEDERALVATFGGQAVAVAEYGHLLLPRFQFDEDGEIRPTVVTANGVLGASGPSWWLARWWATPREASGRSAADLVSGNDARSNELVIELAVASFRRLNLRRSQ